MRKYGIVAELEIQRPGGKLMAALLHEDGTIDRLMPACM